MDADLIKTILGSSGITALVVTLLTLGSKLWENRKAGLRAEDMDDAEWNAAYKAAAEAHVLGYDVPVYHAVKEMQQDINTLRREAGLEPKQPSEIPHPREYPLFPIRGSKDTP